MMLGALTQDLQSGYSGFNNDMAMNAAQANELRKALDAGYAIVNQTGGGALRAQSLEGTLKTTTYTQRHLLFTKLIGRTPGFNTVEEFTEWVSYGTPTGGFVIEGELPASSTSTLVRKYFYMKYAATVRGLTHQATMTGAFGDSVAIENRGGMLYLAERVERCIIGGDQTLALSGQGVEFDGLANQIDATCIVDCQKRALSQPLIDDMAALLHINKGQPDSVILGINAKRDLVKSYFPHSRFQMPVTPEGKLGVNLKQVDTGVGELDLYPSLFLEDGPSPSAGPTHANAPNPAASAALALAGTDANFYKGAPYSATDQNWYAWAVTMGNRFGESAPIFSAVQQMTEANKVLFRHVGITVTNAGAPGTFLPEFVNVYRTEVKGATFVPAALALTQYSLIMRVPIQDQTPGGTTVFNDLNTILPFTSIAFAGQMDEEVLTLRELLPPFRMDLGVQAMAYRWIVAWYLCLALFADKKFGMWLNVGKLPSIP